MALYSYDNTLRLLAEYHNSLLKAADGNARMKILKRINELQKDLNDYA